MEKTIDELNAELLDAKVAEKAASEAQRECYQAVRSHLMNVLEKNIDLSVAKVASCSASAATIQIANHDISLYFEKPWERKNAERGLSINFGCFGAFSKKDVDEVKYCETLGHLAGIIDVLERLLLKTDTAKSLWKAYDEAEWNAYDAENNVRMIESQIKDIEAALKKETILKKLAEGQQIIVKKASAYRPAVVKTIEHVTDKNVLFKEDWGRRTKKSDLVSHILRDGWELA